MQASLLPALRCFYTDVPESISQAFQQVAQLTRELQQSILGVGASPRRLSPRPGELHLLS
eukprot:m.80878 g.80878  ORF g.80878 m.80878 type:complete len:60 (+) comp14561_c0_seq23:637-816(+)